MLRHLHLHPLGDLSQDDDVIRVITQPEKALDLLGIDLTNKAGDKVGEITTDISWPPVYGETIA